MQKLILSLTCWYCFESFYNCIFLLLSLKCYTLTCYMYVVLIARVTWILNQWLDTKSQNLAHVTLILLDTGDQGIIKICNNNSGHSFHFDAFSLFRMGHLLLFEMDIDTRYSLKMDIDNTSVTETLALFLCLYRCGIDAALGQKGKQLGFWWDILKV